MEGESTGLLGETKKLYCLIHGNTEYVYQGIPSKCMIIYIYQAKIAKAKDKNKQKQTHQKRNMSNSQKNNCLQPRLQKVN